ncbi:hypothetical protein TRP8649_04497 [Pelagimonas phthalicica]|jgi:hypothetical protein|uniref:Uncharacterized protein n=1 Tax=Pelagimonas phthalicica TaxID=1037362 RepID=A0A238JJH5_9RHOB|nr:hypothetical protein [Pelagimonas phthalicica]MDP7151261.1 hypothetical protein [Paracoccaceae bacterium]TDS88749.1 hypothetical protein CLV87_4564 [Pelagimonas phthalicica]SMX30354.1 hypothetical protein TRP8649_04497 [Pelagimonas phthalicica]
MSTFDTHEPPAFLASTLVRRLLAWLLWLLFEWLFGKSGDRSDDVADEAPKPWADEIMFRSEAGAF